MYFNVHTHSSSGKQNVEIINLQDDCNIEDLKLYSFGIHPWDIETKNIEIEIEKLKLLIADKRLIAVGEIGLDRAIESSIEKQKEVFFSQYHLAESAGLPIIIHCVRAYADFLHLHNQLKPSVPWIFHGFNGNATIAKQLTDKGCYLSFGEQLLHQLKKQEAIKQIQLQKVFFETDTSDKTIEDIYAKASDLLQMDLEELKNIITQNFKNVFQY
jgi:TatD DNase family protein